MPGALMLLGGDPGIGKSTLLLQVSQKITDTVEQFFMHLVKSLSYNLNFEQNDCISIVNGYKLLQILI